MKRVAVFVTSLVVWLLVTPAVYAACSFGTAGITARVVIGDTGRAMLIHMPAEAKGVAAPLLFVFHGSGGSGADILKLSRLAQISDAHSFVLAAPDGGIPVDETGQHFVWNIPGVPTVTGKVPGPGDADDVAYIKAAVGWLSQQGCVDPKRVYATGFSGGGRMTSWLGCVAADRFAAIAPVVGLRAGNPLTSDPKRPDPNSCRPSRPVPVIAFAGDHDTTNPIEGGGAGYWQYTMHAAEQRWAQLNGCQSAPETRWVVSGVYEERYTDCARGADVVGRITIQGTHTWVADNEAMWAFLSAHTAAN